ncbi:SDR family oxidoreductase [Candidatus Marinarcus aquaticus]|uniref:Short-chain dehydrogenase/reductase n=1 Tax=Candidatus Marinarcus aquaticus TaxID=2044504 RepID=A0A4Q0XPH7_9BACT|nr:SDR family oxidoreductase [Candidatus Marinarcus aquaticus]RXJ57609.1 short-chain dehydrogenase/reductase [Candidatus Marinarcus aquaticus]
MKKVVLITGATSGMGLQTALLLAQKGYIVYAGARKVSQDLEEIIEKHKVTINIIHVDVTQTQSIEAAVNTIMQNEKRIDVLVNNAGFGLLSTLEDGTDEEMYQQFDVNVFGLIKMTRAVLPHMRKAKKGVIINISSFLGKMGLPLLSHYNASKHAVEGITDSLRFEVASYNIRVHSVLAGLFKTNFVNKGLKVNDQTTSLDSAYQELVSHFATIVANAINEGPSPVAIAQAVLKIIEDEQSDIAVQVGAESEIFVPLKKQLDDKAFEQKVKETFNI